MTFEVDTIEQAEVNPCANNIKNIPEKAFGQSLMLL
jgi:hypothetical protein